MFVAIDYVWSKAKEDRTLEKAIFVDEAWKLLASKEEYPVRIVFYGSGEIYDILYVTEAEITVVNNLFSRKEIDGCGHIVVVEKPEEIPKIRISDTIGFCTVKEGGEVEYYRHCSQDRDGYGRE